MSILACFWGKLRQIFSMKQLLSVSIFLLSTIAFGQHSSANSEALINALKEGDVSRFTSYFDSFIDLKLPQKDEIKNIGKTQASLTVKNFFEENGINGFELSSQREIAGTMYIAGKLKSTNSSFNITLMLKKKGEDLNILTVRIN